MFFSTFSKIFLVYEEKFWKDDWFRLAPIWYPNQNGNIFDRLRNFDESNWIENVAYLEKVKDMDKMLIVWLAGCEFTESFTETRIAQELTDFLRRLFNDKNIPQPKQILR